MTAVFLFSATSEFMPFIYLVLPNETISIVKMVSQVSMTILFICYPTILIFIHKGDFFSSCTK